MKLWFKFLSKTFLNIDFIKTKIADRNIKQKNEVELAKKLADFPDNINLTGGI